MFSFRKPSIRQITSIVLFFGLSYCASHYESLLLGPTIDFLNTYLHVTFRTIFGPRPAVPVNLFTLITTERCFFAVAITWIALWVARKSWTQAGFSKDRWMRFFGTGLLSGFLSISALVLSMWAAGGLTFDGIRLHGTNRISYPLRWMIGMLLAGLAEECDLRGFSLFAIAEVVGVLPAALISALIFTGMHVGNPGENFLGLSQVFGFGLLCSMNVLRSGSIWWAVGFHAAWDWTEESFYGTIGSGYWFDGHLFQFQPHGPSMISGGTAGPEGNMLVFAVLGVLLASEFVRLRRKVADAATPIKKAANHRIDAARTSKVH